MAKTKYITHNCAYCHKQTKMELVGDMQPVGGGESQKAWYRCSRCKHSALISKLDLVKEKSGAPVKTDHASSLEYMKEKIFSVGQTIYHAGWDDYGKVMGKQRMSNGIQAITVSFEKSGERRLVENIAQDAVSDAA